MYLDINDDGSDDINLTSTYTYAYGGGSITFHEWWDQTVTSLTGKVNAQSYVFDELIIPNASSSSSLVVASTYQWEEEWCFDGYCDYELGRSTDGVFLNDSISRGFLGYSFMAGEDELWGWIDLEVTQANPTCYYCAIDTMIVHGWGWETSSDYAINAGSGSPVPVPSALWLLTSGLLALTTLSRRGMNRKK